MSNIFNVMICLYFFSKYEDLIDSKTYKMLSFYPDEVGIDWVVVNGSNVFIIVERDYCWMYFLGGEFIVHVNLLYHSN